MRQWLLLILSLANLAVFAQTPQDSREALTNKRIADAQQMLQRIQQMVRAGILPRVRLQQAQDDLADTQDELILDRTLFSPLSAKDWNEQQADDMLSAAQRRLDREQQRLDNARKLVAGGMAGPATLEPFQIELNTRRTMLDLARSRINLMEEAASLAEFQPPAPPASGEDLSSDEDSGALAVSGMEHYEGDGLFDESRDLPALEAAFAAKFDHPLPISADGETELHRALGFDHRGRVDVALNPSDPEGVWLRQYLKARRIPFYAFTHAFPGRATAAHIHIGPGSTRLHASD
ncbi:MAG TPA: hypothetical protein VMB25_07140 [Bryobacteraceae bacterium]|nr:hypothetical protein [Bryobacteraceae bacterium]